MSKDEFFERYGGIFVDESKEQTEARLKRIAEIRGKERITVADVDEWALLRAPESFEDYRTSRASARESRPDRRRFLL